MFYMFCTCTMLSFMAEQLNNRTNVNNGERETYIEFHLAVSGFHYYCKYWRPNIDEKMIYIHEQENLVDMFAIKTCLEDGRSVGHLSREVS